jgi:hypothetical protein
MQAYKFPQDVLIYDLWQLHLGFYNKTTKSPTTAKSKKKYLVLTFTERPSIEDLQSNGYNWLPVV